MTDLIVAGGGPVGLATAIRARLAGMSVVVVEPREAPIDKACGEGLMPGAVSRLRALSVEPPGREFTGIRYLAPGGNAVARFRGGVGLGVRRTDLHAALSARADEAGVERVRDRVTEVAQDADGVSVVGMRARWLVAADGLHSPVRRALGLDRPPSAHRRYGQRRHVAVTPWTDVVEVYWSARSEAYVTPVGPDTVGVAILSGPGRSYDELLGEFPPLQRRLATAPSITAVAGAGPLRQVAAARVQGRVLLVGDAAGYVDALTGEGIATGLACAEAAVEAICSGSPETYEKAWLAATRRYRLITSGLLWAAGHRLLRRRIVPAAAAMPWVFSRAVDELAR